MKRWICAVLLLALLAACLTAGAAYATLRPGARGQAVIDMQRALIAQGYPLTADGVYGRQTRAAVLRFQAAHNLKQDGIAGNQTLTRLFDTPANVTGTQDTAPAATGTTSPAVSVPAAPSISPSAYGTVRPGARGQAVIALQQALNLHGFPLALDGSFGRMTRSALTAFQSRNNLKPDGIAGPQTWARLLAATANVSAGTAGTPDTGNAATDTASTPAGTATGAGTGQTIGSPQPLPAQPADAGASVASSLSKGSDAAQVRLLQGALNTAGTAQLGTDGEYGTRTVAAVRSFQTQYGLTVNGTADPTTLALLYTRAGVPSDALMRTGINQTGGAVSIRSAARTSAGIVQTVPAGAAVTVLRQMDGWYHVSFKHRSGYLPENTIRLIDAPAPLVNLARGFTQGAYTPTGDARTDLLGLAFTQLGFRGGSSESRILAGTGPGGPYSKYGAYYNDPSESYCSYFVSWAARHAGIPETVINNARDVDGVFYDQQNAFVYFFAPRAAQVQAQKLSAAARVERDTYTPQIGDLIYFRWSSARAATTFSHIGIVYAVDANHVYTLEGAAGGSVDTRMYRLDDTDIVGYARPKY